MRTLLRNTVTGLYLQAPGQWTANAEQALNFRFKTVAAQKAALWQLQDVELAFALEHSPQLLATMPLEQPGGPRTVSVPVNLSPSLQARLPAVPEGHSI